jgi:hypothetical protein
MLAQLSDVIPYITTLDPSPYQSALCALGLLLDLAALFPILHVAQLTVLPTLEETFLHLGKICRTLYSPSIPYLLVEMGSLAPIHL